MKVNVKKLINSNGNVVANHSIIIDAKGETLRSYDSNVVFKAKNGKVILGKDYNYSNTTKKYVSQYLGEPFKVIAEKVKTGVYQIKDL